ncbi:MAG: hypothetical protein LUI14_06235 [Lachnospiraceae bacterium]|nr:hypothetical protein [Lachnospiraceae bacterium]
MYFTMNLTGQVNQMRLPKTKALWPLFETIVNSIQSLEETKDCEHPKIIIYAKRPLETQMNTEGEEELNRIEEFIVSDNGEGFTERNYKSFLEAYSTLKLKKGCKGIGRFLWLKAFKNVHIKSIYKENDVWYEREFEFSLNNVIEPEDNRKEIECPDNGQNLTEVQLSGFFPDYRDTVALSLESLVKKIIEHCLPYFIMEKCPEIVLRDNAGSQYILNDYYKRLYKNSLHRDDITIKGTGFSLYHMAVSEGAEKHELHLCANSREVKTVDLSNNIPNLDKKIVSEDQSFYYVGYMVGEYLDQSVNVDRYEFDFSDAPLLNSIEEKEIIDAAIEYIKIYLSVDLDRISEEKRRRIDDFVRSKKPQYRYLLNHRKNVYDAIPVGLKDDKLDLELYKQEQMWEYEIKQQKLKIEEKKKNSATDDPQFIELFKEYCSSVTQLSQASLAEYIVRRKAVIDLLEKALEATDDGKYSREAQIHSIICPMRVTSDDVEFDEMNLWLIDDRLAYHQFLASDQPMKSLPVLENNVPKRMDLAIFDKAISYSAEDDVINAITIVELKRPQRDDLREDDKNPINQVLRYVADIKSGKVLKANGRGFGAVQNAAFYCYVIADMTESLAEDAENASLYRTPDGEGFFGFNQARGTYIEVISYDKLLKDAKKRNQVLFDKLFRPKAENLIILDKAGTQSGSGN